MKFADFREMDDGIAIDADICVIGAGAAGITLALALSSSHREVLVLEGGGLEFDPDIQKLYHLESVGRRYFNLDMSRLRLFGGTTNHWDGDCRALDAIDFEKRAWVPHSGWPIKRSDLEPYFPRAHEICELGSFEFDERKWPGLVDHTLAFDRAKIENRMWQRSPPTQFSVAYRDDLEEAGNVRVLLHANCVELVANQTASAIESIRIRSLTGREGIVKPRTAILACGGIDNARMLLASNAVQKAGLGNEHDLVGRYFMEHPHAVIGFAVPTGGLEKFHAYSRWINFQQPDLKTGAPVGIHFKAGISERVQREQHLLNTCVDVGFGFDRSPGYMSARKVAKDMLAMRLDGFGEAMLAVLGDLDGFAGGVYRRITHEEVLWFGANGEQEPDPQSRVTLTSERDLLGLPLAKLDWRISELDKRSVRVTCRLVGEELARLGLARMRLDPWLVADDVSWTDLGARYHHIGTTRMSDDPGTGVVDADCRVHGIGNLYIAGSSIFPTSGYANPTLNIVALSLRLADHLRNGA